MTHQNSTSWKMLETVLSHLNRTHYRSLLITGGNLYAFPGYLVPLFQNEFDFHENEPKVHLEGFAQRLVLTQRQKAISEMA